MRGKTGMMLLVIGTLLLLLGSSQAAFGCYEVKIFCAGPVSTPNPATVRLTTTDRCVTFVLDGTCTTVDIAGTGPIGAFTLTKSGENKRSIHFLNGDVGTYTYTTDGHLGKASVGTGRIVVPEGVPALTPFGLGVLVLLLMAAAIWLFRKKRVVPAS